MLDLTTICPTITATTELEYSNQLAQVTSFASRIHIDIADGIFTPRKLIGINQIWWPANLVADLHIMYKNPFVYIEAIKTLHPNLVIVHAEAEGDFASFANELHQHGMEVGVALLPETSVDILSAPIGFIDHVLIFSGHLSQFGGQADLSLLEKVRKLREQKPSVEIGWDGGVSEKNARELAKSGVDVLNVGGHIHQAPNPQLAFNELAVAANGPAT